MTGSRLVNDHSFTCDSLKDMIVERFFAFYEEGNPDNIYMIVLKLQEKKLWQRFFLDAGIGFWEEGDEESLIQDFEDDPVIELDETYKITGKLLHSIDCTGSYDELSQMDFRIGEVHLNLRFKDQMDCESDTILTRL
jgi:hypothetical protein